MAKLTFITESKGFRYENGDYVQTGNKFISDGVFKRLDAGCLLKSERPIAYFNYRVEDGEISNLGVSFMDQSETATILSEITASFNALKAE